MAAPGTWNGPLRSALVAEAQRLKTEKRRLHFSFTDAASTLGSYVTPFGDITSLKTMLQEIKATKPVRDFAVQWATSPGPGRAAPDSLDAPAASGAVPFRPANSQAASRSGQNQKAASPNRQALIQHANCQAELAGGLRRNEDAYRQWREAAGILEQMRKVKVTAADLAKFSNPKDKWAPRLVSRVHNNLIDVLSGTEQLLTESGLNTAQRKALEEIPPVGSLTYRSARSALLIALTGTSEARPMTKDALVRASQPLSDDAMLPTRETPIAGWEAVHTLTRNGLVVRSVQYRSYARTGIGAADLFWLTSLGEKWAAVVSAEHRRRAGSLDGAHGVWMHAGQAAAPRISEDATAKAVHYLTTGTITGMSVTTEGGMIVVRATCSSQTKKKGKPYTVMCKLLAGQGQLRQSFCSCPFTADVRNRGLACKHVLALKLHYEASAEVPPATQPSTAPSGSSQTIPRKRAREEDASAAERPSASKVRISIVAHSRDEAQGWHVRKIKRALAEHGVPTDNCVEKDDLINLLMGVQKSLGMKVCGGSASSSGSGCSLAGYTSLKTEAPSVNPSSVKAEATTWNLSSVKTEATTRTAIDLDPDTDCDDSDIDLSKRADIDLSKRAAPSYDWSLAMLFDVKERGAQKSYTSIFEHTELRLRQCGMQTRLVQAPLIMADYLWIDQQGFLKSVAVERKTIGNLILDSSTCNQLKQTRRLRQAGFESVVVLLEGSEWKAREQALHLDKPTITSEEELFQYICREARAGVQFLECAEGGRTAIYLSALTRILAATDDRNCQPWQTAVQKKHVDKVCEKLGDHMDVDTDAQSLRAVASAEAAELNQILEQVEVAPSDVDFMRYHDLQAAIEAFPSPTLFAARFGTSVAVAKSVVQRSSDEAIEIEHGVTDFRVSSSSQSHGYCVTCRRMTGADFVNKLAEVPEHGDVLQRAEKAAAIVAGSRKHGPWDIYCIVVEQVDKHLRWRSTEVGGSDPLYYCALVICILVVRYKILVKQARSSADAAMFSDALRTVMHPGQHAN
eukprot:TRINITY_DN2856_c0_g1_i1.p1 TRINITY_DN2856_c0_g1~~TRINITY_DN2856_c0_g1_i1.p1  ORF type:complete len:1024 (-),score=214.39 TRINITY_DN2856_c0_g1_i1:356-3427(-)